MTTVKQRRARRVSLVVAVFAAMLAIPAGTPAGATGAPPPPSPLRVVSRLLSDGNISTTVMDGTTVVASAEAGSGTEITVSSDGTDIGLVPTEKLNAYGLIDQSGGSTESDNAIRLNQEAFMHPDQVRVRNGHRSIRVNGQWAALPTRHVVATRTVALGSTRRLVPSAMFATQRRSRPQPAQATAAHTNSTTVIGSGHIYSSGCGSLSRYSRSYGCFNRTSVPPTSTTNYSIDSSQATGRGVGHMFMEVLANRTGYANSGYNKIVNWDPKSDQKGDNCATYNAGLAYRGVAVSISFPKCADRISLRIQQHYMRTEWLGNEPSKEIGTGAMDIISVARGHYSGFIYHVAAETCIYGIHDDRACRGEWARGS